MARPATTTPIDSAFGPRVLCQVVPSAFDARTAEHTFRRSVIEPRSSRSGAAVWAVVRGISLAGMRGRFVAVGDADVFACFGGRAV
jgi:hypothetical protein